METSKFAYTSELPGWRNNFGAVDPKMYTFTWYGKGDLPADTWDTKCDAGGGWYRYTRKLEEGTPQIKALQTEGEAGFYRAMFPRGDVGLIYNATVDSPVPPYTPAGGRDAD